MGKGFKTYIGTVRTKEKPWGNELSMSVNREDLAKIEQCMGDGAWASIDIKERKERDGEKTHYGVIWTKEDPEHPSEASESASEGVPELGGSNDVPPLDSGDEDNLPF